MLKEELELLVPDELISEHIYLIRGQKVMIDRDLARLYGVETKALNQAVKRNPERFPEDFMFELSSEEAAALRSQNVTLKRGQHSKYLPAAFTEQGVAMLSSVLKSKRAIKVNIQIVRLFTRLRKTVMDNTELKMEVDQIKQKLDTHNQHIELVFRFLDELVEKKESGPQRSRIGFVQEIK